MAEPAPLARSKSTRQPMKAARSSNPNSLSLTPLSNSSSVGTDANATSSQSHGSNATTRPRPQSTIILPSQAHARTRSVNVPPATKPASTPSTRNPSASVSQHRVADVASRSASHNVSNETFAKPLTSTSTSTSRNTTPRTSREHKQPAPPQATQHPRSTFSTYQQEFKPSRRAAPTSSTSTTPSNRASNPPPATPHPTTHLRAQTHLLHLSLLHARAPQTQKSYLASAESALHARFAALYALYTRALLLERAARQAANLRALHAWSGGNTAALSRKLNGLTSVLAELMALTQPAAAAAAAAAHGGAGAEAVREAGAYARCVEGFERWVAWVRAVWAVRDAADVAGSAEAEADAGGHADADGLRIEGLGDGAKAALRTLTGQLNVLHGRLQDLAASPIPDVDATTTGAKASQEEAASSTPAHVLNAARKLVDGMQEELQVMREVEFEVVVGEQAWVEDRVRKIGEEIDGF